MDRFCTFLVGSRRIGLPLALVRETLPPTPMSPLLLGPAWVLGLISVRGQVIPVLDLGAFVGSGTASHLGSETHFVLIEYGEFRFVVATHEVGTTETEVAHLPSHSESAIYPALDAQAEDASGPFHIIQLDRLQASLTQALGFERLIAA